jgi:hypothetical protein
MQQELMFAFQSYQDIPNESLFVYVQANLYRNAWFSYLRYKCKENMELSSVSESQLKGFEIFVISFCFKASVN